MSEAARLSISVVTPSFNQGSFIGRTLQSVADQSRPALEHVVYDAASRDGTVEVLRAFGPRVRWVSEPDRGQAHAVNKGIAATSGEIVAWINSDDVYLPGAFERAARFLEDHPEVDVVYGDADHIDADDRVIEPYPTAPFDRALLYHQCFICQPAAFFRRRCIAAYGALDERLHYCMDYEYWLRLARAGARFAYLPEKLAGSRLHPQTKTLGSRAAVQREINDMFRRMLGYVPDQWLWNYSNTIAEERVDRAAHPWRFTLALATTAAASALRWNRWITRDMRRVMLRGLLRSLGRRLGMGT